MRRRSIRLTIAAMLAAAPVAATGARAQADCFDAEVSGTLLRQSPTVAPRCYGCFIMRWPWIADLHVRRVHTGTTATGPLTVLTLQHTYFRRDLRVRHWQLRRNTLGGFNVVIAPEEGARLPRCAADAPPARPLVQPEAGETVDDLRREGEAYYGRQPGT